MDYPISQSSTRSSVETSTQGYRTEGSENDRKRLGQYFTSMPLSRLLATFAVDDDTRSLLDPMSGDGNLLEAAARVALLKGAPLQQVDGIELDPLPARLCAERLVKLRAAHPAVTSSVVTGNAFDPASIAKLNATEYDLVIANPPYVRYQALTRRCENTSSPDANHIRHQLTQVAAERGKFWSCLAQGYSGHADLSVPSWLLSAMLVAPGGRLALVVPATWQTREYGDILRYLMACGFFVELVVEDSQPGWFSDALVRTNLLVALRHADGAIPLLCEGACDEGNTKWLTIAPAAASEDSIVGNAFPGASPEQDLAEWMAGQRTGERPGIVLRDAPRGREAQWLRSHSAGRRWYIALEGRTKISAPRNDSNVPAPLLGCIQASPPTLALGELEGVSLGQGLRTGCNGFFYVDVVVEESSRGHCLIESRGLFPGKIFEVPDDILKPVLRRQSELSAFARQEPLKGRLLDLRGWVLDTDAILLDYRHLSRLQIMANGLAKYVKAAAQSSIGDGSELYRIPLLSAVRTNVRAAKGEELPRFWYTIPDLVPRHRPHLFVPRISNKSPLVLANRPDPIVIDANFSTFTVTGSSWTNFALLAFLRSTWSLACMELLGTRMGGGALKLEAAQLRRLPVPALLAEDIRLLHIIGEAGISTEETLLEIDQIVLRALLPTQDEFASRRLKLVELLANLQGQRRN